METTIIARLPSAPAGPTPPHPPTPSSRPSPSSGSQSLSLLLFRRPSRTNETRVRDATQSRPTATTSAHPQSHARLTHRAQRSVGSRVISRGRHRIPPRPVSGPRWVGLPCRAAPCLYPKPPPRQPTLLSPVTRSNSSNGGTSPIRSHPHTPRDASPVTCDARDAPSLSRPAPHPRRAVSFYSNPHRPTIHATTTPSVVSSRRLPRVSCLGDLRGGGGWR